MASSMDFEWPGVLHFGCLLNYPSRVFSSFVGFLPLFLLVLSSTEKKAHSAAAIHGEANECDDEECKKKKPAANIAGKDKQAAKRPAANIAGNDSPQVKKHCKALPFPGKPKKTQPSIEFRGYTIVTDIPSGCWRVKQDGKHVTCASFACDPIKGWNKVTMTIFKK